MFFTFFLVGFFIFFSGLFYLLDTIVWELESGENYINFAMKYAETRHCFYAHEIVYAGIIILAGILFLFFTLRHIKKCNHCNKYILKSQNFCHKCGNKLKRM